MSCRVKATGRGARRLSGARGPALGGGDRASASITLGAVLAREGDAEVVVGFTLENFCAPSRSDRCTDTPAVVWGRATAPPAAALW